MPCGDHLGAAFELADFLDASRRRGAARRRRSAWRPTSCSTSAPQPTADGWAVADAPAPPDGGACATSGDVDPGVAAIVGGVRRPAPARRRARRGGDVGRSSVGELTAAALPIVRRLVERAFLLPVAA